MADTLIIIKDVPHVKWTTGTFRPICLEHSFELDLGCKYEGLWEAVYLSDEVTHLRCLEGPHIIELPMALEDIQAYIRKKLKSKQYSDAKLVDLDGLLVPVSKKMKATIGKDDYFVTSQVRNSKRGDQVVIYAGKKGHSEGKAQIFIDPKHRKMSFDQNDLNPTDVFVKVEATFQDGTKHKIQSGKKE